MNKTGKALLYQERNKLCLRLQKRYNTLLKARRALPVIPLEKPVHYGWKRFFVVRDDIRRSPQGAFFEKLLPLINNIVICRRKDFKEKDYKTGTYKPIEQELYDIDEKKYTDLSPKQKSYFMYVTKRYKRWDGRTEYKRVYVFSKPWMYVLKVKPHYLTHTQLHDAEIESELTEINQKLWVSRFAYHYGDDSRYSDWYWEGEERKEKIKKKLAKQEIKEYFNKDNPTG